MDLTTLASHPTAALALALAVIGGLLVGLRLLWRQLALAQAEIRRLYELNRAMTTAIIAAVAGRHCGELDQIQDIEPSDQAQPQPGEVGGGGSPDPNRDQSR